MPAGSLKLKAQIMRGNEIAMGPGKAALLEAIDRLGSISAAARDLGMSYRRCWMLVDAMNRCFTQMIVETHQGGGRESGARLTDKGRLLLDNYRALEAALEQAAAPYATPLLAELRDRRADEPSNR